MRCVVKARATRLKSRQLYKSFDGTFYPEWCIMLCILRDEKHWSGTKMLVFVPLLCKITLYISLVPNLYILDFCIANRQENIKMYQIYTIKVRCYDFLRLFFIVYFLQFTSSSFYLINRMIVYKWDKFLKKRVNKINV